MQKPTLGRIVWYRTDGRNFDYLLPAVVSVTVESQNREGLKAAGIPTLKDPFDVHLRVFSPGADYVEYVVPFDPEGGRRTWRWPEDA